VFIEYDPLLEPAGEVSDLKEADMVLYNKLRQWRREQAEAQGVPVFIISTNGILKQVAIRKPETVEELKNIRGIGKAKLEKYGQELIDLVKTFTEKT
jgi:ATP-dependent DNA helicase RecQ